MAWNENVVYENFVLENKFLAYMTLKPNSSMIFVAFFISATFSLIIGLDGATTPIVSPFFNLFGIIK